MKTSSILFSLLLAATVAIAGGDFVRTLLANDAAILRSISQ